MLGPLPALVAAPTAAAKLNIVFIFADDWGWGDLSCHGHPWLKTPHLDGLARQGADFQQFNVLSPVCSPIRQNYLDALASPCMAQGYRCVAQRSGSGRPCRLPAKGMTSVPV